MTDTSAVSEAPVDAPSPDQPQAGADQAAQAPKVEHGAADAVDRAFAKLDEQEKAEAEKPTKQEPDGKEPEKAEAKADKSAKKDEPAKAEKADAKAKDDSEGGRERGPDGKFVAKDAAKAEQPAEGADKDAAEKAEGDKPDNFTDAPPRFSPDAKAAWKDAPEPVRAEITRAVKELEGGIAQYQQAYEPFRDFAKQLQDNGQTFQEVLQHYTGIEDMLRQDPVQGLDRICRNMGMDLRTVAAHVMGQPADQQASQTSAVIHQLEQKIAGLEKQLGGVSQTMETQRMSEAEKQIMEFANAPGHERYKELEDDIAFLVETGRASGTTAVEALESAYELAARLNPAPQSANPAPSNSGQEEKPDPKADLEAQTRKGSLSVAGSPASGSNPGTVRKPAKSAMEAVERASARFGF
jgi:hypothetical protein